MLDSFFLLRAMNGIREEDLILAQEFLEYTDTGPQKRSYRRLVSYALIAAILIALLSVTAYALGWFGLGARVMPAEDTGPYAVEESPQAGGWMASNGYTDSPEVKASMEWQQVYWELCDEALENSSPDWPEDMGKYAQTAMIYGAFDQNMLDALLAIRDKYGLRLHTEFLSVGIANEYFYPVTGLEPFLLAEENVIYWRCQYIFEDGSFKGEGSAQVNNKDLDYSLERYKSGAIDPYCLYMHNPTAYEEWQFELEDHTLDLALKRDEQYSEGFIFYQTGDCFITIHFVAGQVGENIDRSDVEALAALFNYDALSGGETDLSRIN